MAEALGYVLGVKVQVVNTPFEDMIPSLQSGRADFPDLRHARHQEARKGRRFRRLPG